MASRQLRGPGLRSLGDYEKHFEELRVREEVELLRSTTHKINAREAEMRRYIDDFAAPLSHDVSMLLGKIREEGNRLGSPQLDALVDKLQAALDDQMYMFFRQREAEIQEPLLHDTAFADRVRRDKLRQAADESLASKQKPTASVACECEISLPCPSDNVSSVTYLMAEALARNTRCEKVRIYLSVDDTHGVRHVTSFPSEEGSPILARPLQSAVFNNCIAVSGGYSTKETVKPRGRGSGLTAEPVYNGPRTVLAFPIVAWKGDALLTIGVIELTDKEPYGDDDGRKFTEKDEVIVFSAAQLLGGLMERYPFQLFRKNMGPSLSTANIRCGASHLPPVVESDVEGASVAANHSVRAKAQVPIFRGAAASLHRFSADERNGERIGAVAMQQGSTDLKNVEESLDSLNMMWRLAHEENTAMHRQCRRYAEQLKELQAIVHAVPSMLQRAREIPEIDDVHSFLRTCELGIKSGNASNLQKAMKKPGSQEKMDSDSSTRVGPISAIHYDGPEGIRPYTVDPETKREQEIAIAAHMAAATEERERAEREARAKIPRYSYETKATIAKATADPPFQRPVAKTAFRLKVPHPPK